MLKVFFNVFSITTFLLYLKQVRIAMIKRSSKKIENSFPLQKAKPSKQIEKKFVLFFPISVQEQIGNYLQVCIAALNNALRKI